MSEACRYSFDELDEHEVDNPKINILFVDENNGDDGNRQSHPSHFESKDDSSSSSVGTENNVTFYYMISPLSHANNNPSSRIQQMISITIGLCISLVIIDGLTSKRLESGSIYFFDWIEHHPFLGVLAVILVYILATICFVPGSILTIGIGFAFGKAFNSSFFGVALASIAVFLGASIGSICCLLLGRYLFRDCVLRLAQSYPLFLAIDRALEANGFQIMILLRLSPLIPYNALDYISGITSISLKSYCLALIGLFPGAVAFCYIGATASSLTEGKDNAARAKFVVLFAGLFFAIAGVIVASYYAKQELGKILALQQENQQETNEQDADEKMQECKFNTRHDDDVNLLEEKPVENDVLVHLPPIIL